MMNESVKSQLENQLRDIAIATNMSIDTSLAQTIDIDNLTPEQINDLKKIIAASMVTANDKGAKVPDTSGKPVDFGDPISVANSASDTIEYIRLAFEAVRGNMESLQQILVSILDYVTVKLVANARFIAEKGLPVALDSLRAISYTIDGVIPIGDFLRSIIDFAEMHDLVIKEYLIYVFGIAVPKFTYKIKEFIARKLSTKKVRTEPQIPMPSVNVEVEPNMAPLV